MSYLDIYDLRNDVPPLVSEALKYYGMKEVKGKGSNAVILNMAKFIGVDNIYKDDDTAWCALFMCAILKAVNYPMSFRQYECLRAKSFLKWGDPISINDMKRGDIAIFTRSGGGHVGIVIAESKDTVFVLGGNQSNMVNIMELAKSRISGIRRWYPNRVMPASAKKYVINSQGNISKNEA